MEQPMEQPILGNNPSTIICFIMAVSICCVYQNCFNSRFKNRNLSFFRFPAKDVNRCTKWLKNCGNLELTKLDFDKLSLKLLCEKHFKDSDYFNAKATPKRLHSSAIPICIDSIADDSADDLADDLADNLEENLAANLADDLADDKEHLSIPSMDDVKPVVTMLNIGESSASRKVSVLYNSRRIQEPTRKETKLKRKLVTQRKLTKKYVEQIRRLRKKFEYIPIMSKMSHISSAARTLIYMQNSHKPRQKWSAPERRLALSLYYKSPSTYRFMLKALKFKLPGLSTIRTWLRICHLQTGVNTTLIKKLKSKVKTMTAYEKQCVLMFDEIALRPSSELNQQFGYVEGFEDLEKFGRRAIQASSATLFYLRGLQYSWKIPFCYYVHESMQGEILRRIVIDVLDKLFDIGLNPKIIVCNQGMINRRVTSLLGICPEKPFFAFKDNKVYISFDTPHLIKSLRDNFMNPNLIFKVGGETVRWSDLVSTYEIYCRRQTDRTLLKLTRAHVHPTNFEKMNVKLATQIFLNPVAAAILTANETQQLKSDSACATAAFIKHINDIFDCLNSLNICDPNPLKRGFSMSFNRPVEVLKIALSWLKTIIVEDAKSNKNLKNIHCLNGLILTISSVLDLWKELVVKKECKYLLTGRINQNALHSAFGMIRQYRGYNPHPSCKQFRLALQHNMHMRLLEPIMSTNCEFDDDDFLEISDEILLTSLNVKEEHDSSSDRHESYEDQSSTLADSVEISVQIE